MTDDNRPTNPAEQPGQPQDESGSAAGAPSGEVPGAGSGWSGQPAATSGSGATEQFGEGSAAQPPADAEWFGQRDAQGTAGGGQPAGHPQGEWGNPAGGAVPVPRPSGGGGGEWSAPVSGPGEVPGQPVGSGNGPAGQVAGASGEMQGSPGAPPPHSEWARPSGEQVVFGAAGQGGQGGPPPQYLVRPRPQATLPPPQQRRGAGGLVAAVAVLSLLVGGGAGALGGYLVADSNAGNASVANALDQQPPADQTSSSPEGSVEAVAEKVSPSVVQLQVQGRGGAGEGSGFVISSDGLIVTNNHVVEVAAQNGEITAVFADGSTAPATVVGRDPTSDVAVVKAEGKTGLPIVDLGSSESLKVGQGVVAIGSPFELSGTVTSGIVSSLHRPTRAGGEDGSQATVMDAIQTDAAINPGNSGGPLVDMQGQVIGINSAIYSPQSGSGQSAGSVGIGFAIPIDQARRTAEEIVNTGKATQTVLGVSVRDNADGGALVAEVVAGGAGEQAGLKADDVITKLDDRRIDTSDALVAAVRSHAPGDKVRLELDNGSRTVEATLAGQTVETE